MNSVPATVRHCMNPTKDQEMAPTKRKNPTHEHFNEPIIAQIKLIHTCTYRAGGNKIVQ